MTEIELQNLINKLKQENEIPWIEAKVNLSDLNQIGKTISALANSASYKNEDYAYFIWGLENDSWKIIGTNFDLKKVNNFFYKKERIKQIPKMWLLNKFEPKVYFEEFEPTINGERIYILRIKNCENKPIHFDKIAQIRIDSHNQELLKYPEIHKDILNKFDKLEKENKNNKKEMGKTIGKVVKNIISKKDKLVNNITEINQNPDWSAQICEGATVNDLDEVAIEIAKIGYIAKQAKTEEDKKRILNYSNEIFLDEAKITKDGKITNTAILLLGKEKSQHYLQPMGGAEIFWRVMDTGDDQPFKMPLIKAIQNVVNKLTTRNIEMSLKMLGQPMMNKIKPNYSEETLRECVANCVAHQDYTQSCRILIYEERNINIRFENAGASLYSKEEFNQIRLKKKIPNKYRNEFLRNAMEQIGLIEAKGTGHHKIYQYNTKEVYLPLPEIDWNNQKEFVLTLYGASLDPKFAEILQQKTDLEPEIILLLDQVQKGFRIDQKIFYNLKKQGLVEGTPTKGKLSFEFMKLIGKENEYIDESEDEHLKILIYKKIKQTKNCKRSDIEGYIYPKFSENLSNKQKYAKLHNMLSNLKKEGWVDSIGGRRHAIWVVKREMKLE